MSVAPYPEYKDSGVEWIGEIPSHWQQRRLGNYLTERREKVSDKEFPPLSVTKNGIVPQLDNAAKTDDGDNRKKVCAGDFVINGRSDRKGSSGLSSLEGSVSLINIVLRAHTAIEMRFVGWLLKSVSFQEEFYRYGKGIVADLWSTNFSEMRNIILAMPPVSEQSAIAAFLDQETGKIDALVAEQERLIALLKEKRQAVISQAVTKGLNPNAPMKDSGIEWLGQVPAHWTITKTSYLFKSAMGQTILAEELVEDGEWPVFSATEGDHYFGRINNPEVRLDAGDIVIPARGNSIGHVKLVKEPSTTTQTTIYCKLRTSEKVLARFAYHYFRGCKEWLFYFTQTAIPQITVREVNSNPTLVPPMLEQAEIADFIEDAQTEFDTLITEATQAITLLRERRAALISAAVTGKIDVRSLAPTKQEAA